MFDDMIRTLRELEGHTQIPVSIQYDDQGYVDRECPSEDCLFQFKILGQDWQEKVCEEEVFCPSCGHTSAAGNWSTQEQAEHFKNAALAHVAGKLNTAMAKDAERWNRRQPKGGLVSIQMKVDQKPKAVLLPPAAADPMRLKINCTQCECHYAVVGAAYFCPACGHNAADQQFAHSIAGILQSLEAIETVRAAITDRDTAENTIRLLVENSLQSAVTAFQRYAEALYAARPSAPTARRNAFQSLTEGSELWAAAGGNAYADHLIQGELVSLQIAFQQRHLLAHTQGFVDADYLRKSGDTRYQVGQRIVVRDSAVREATNLIAKLADGLLTDSKALKGP